MKQTHVLKAVDRYFDAIERGDKTFEVRRNDRAFQTGDIIELVKVTEGGTAVSSPGGNAFSRVTLRRQITYLLQGGQFGIEPAYCVLGLGPVTSEEAA